MCFRLTPREFNSYGSRRGNDAVMARGTFANIRLVNKFMQKAGPKTLHIPSGEYMNLYCIDSKCQLLDGWNDYGVNRSWADIIFMRPLLGSFPTLKV